ncbi:MAG TPA: aldehyde dehydrogenase family protein [Polyangia bacterium]|nr:aldehyde dehydrogenase family protein [Polyangia bacterium]
MIDLDNFIDGLARSGGARFDDRSPTDGSVVARVAEATRSELDDAVAIARRAQSAWAERPAPERGEILLRCGKILEERRDAIAQLMAREMGKCLREARGDVQEAIDTCLYAAGEGRRLFGRTVPSELPSKWALTMPRPLGVVAAVTPWNFPIAVPSWKIVPALLAGNAVVWKPAEEAPATGHELWRALVDGGVPAGALGIVHGGAEVGRALVAHAGVDAITFTGSTAAGREIAEVAGRGLKRVSLELGGKNPCIVHADADLALAADGLVWGAFGTAGQRCTATSRLIVHRSIADELIARVAERASRLRLGDPLDERTDVGPLIDAAAKARLESAIAGARSDGLAVKSRAVDASLAAGNFVAPSLVLDVPRDHALAQRELFGPLLAVLRYDDLDEAIAIANEIELGLSSSIYTRDVGLACRAVERIQAGITYVNSPTIGAEAHLPFGGVKATGNGHREGGWAAYEFFCETKTVYLDFSGRLQRAQLDNRTE